METIQTTALFRLASKLRRVGILEETCCHSNLQKRKIIMDDTKQFEKNEKELETLIQRIKTINIGMEFGVEKCAMLIMKSGKKTTDGRNQESIIMFGEKKNYKYFGILETDTMKQVDMKEKIRKRDNLSKPSAAAEIS